MFFLHFWNTLGSAARQKTQFESGRFKDMSRHAFFEAAAAAPLPAQNTFFITGDVVWRWQLPFEGSLELQNPLGQLGTTLGCKLCKRHSTMFVRPTVVDEPLLLLETLSACLAGLGLGVDIAKCFWCL